MARSKKKRSHAQYAQDLLNDTEDQGVASTLAYIENADADDKSGDQHSDQWQMVDRHSKKKSKISGDTSKNEEIHAHDKKRDKKDGNRPALTVTGLHNITSPLSIRDLQSLVLYCLADGVSPQWLSVRHHSQVRKAVVLLVPGLEKDMFDGNVKLEKFLLNNKSSAEPASTSTNDQVTKTPNDSVPKKLIAEQLPESLRPLANIFEHVIPVRTPGDERFNTVHSPILAMLNSPIPLSKEEKKAEKAIKGPKPFQHEKHSWANQPTPITTFLTSKEDLQENDYTLHSACFSTQNEKDRDMTRRVIAKETEEFGWKESRVLSMEDGDVPDTEIQKGSLTDGRNVLAMDCEMCKVEGNELALTRISIVSWDGSVVMDELVKPEKPIVDYLTAYSGITKAKLEPVTTTLSDIQSRLLELLTARTILIGHSLNSDLTALKMTHPFIVDTTLLYQHPRGPPLKSSLKWLSKKYLNREIQKGHGTEGHDSVEDATACLDLVRLKCEKGAKWASIEGSGEPIFKRLSRTRKSGSNLSSNGKIGALVDYSNTAAERQFGKIASVCINCNSDVEVVEGVRRSVLGDPDGAIVPGGGVDFTWARLRELEVLRGWSQGSRDSTGSASTENLEPAGLSESTPETSPNTDLSAAVSRTIQHILSIHAFLPPCTLLVVYSGTGDPREMSRLQEMQRTFRKEYSTKKWDEISVKWTDVEEQALKKARKMASRCIGLAAVT